MNIMNNSEKNINIVKNIINCTGKVFNKPNSLSKQYKKYLISMIENADVLLPNSIEEIEVLCNFINVDFKRFSQKTKVVVNAIDKGMDIEFKKIETKIPDKYVLECARIEPTKNQYKLVKALYDYKEIPIVFVGNQKSDKNYFEKVKKISQKRGNVFFIDEVSHEEVNYFYRNAAVHVLPSFRESPGLSTLEALYNGCKIVVSDKRFCPVNSYFKGIATNINPMDEESIKEGVIKAYKSDMSMDDKKSALYSTLTWENAARQTMFGYESISKS
ncbi:glycosyltransferase [Paraclostridium sp. AKS46]|nr:glycosyltransferase [Paraclostridium sp. AKS46]